MGRRYAEGTDVTPERSVEQIRKYSERRGAEEFTYAMGSRGGMVRFLLEGKPVQFVAEFPTDVGSVKKAEQEYARRWRVIYLKVKTAFEVWQEGQDSTVEEAFMPYLMLPGGGTVGDMVKERLDGVYAGEIPSVDLLQPALGPGGQS